MHTDHAGQLALWNSRHSYSFYQIYDPSSPDLNQVDWPKLGKSTASIIWTKVNDVDELKQLLIDVRYDLWRYVVTWRLVHMSPCMWLHHIFNI